MKKLSMLLLLVLTLSFVGCAANPAKDSAKTYTELKAENKTLDKNYQQLAKEYEFEKENAEAQKEEFEELKAEFEQYKEKMQPYEAEANK